ncbi:MAG: hypothetical protein ACYCQJ_14150 [Nitrososphaerales archaeon]
MDLHGEEVVVCECNILHGYILDSFFKVSATSRKRITIIFKDNEILTCNDNENNNYVNITRLFAEEIELEWHNTPLDKRFLVLSYEKETMKKALAKSAKRDQYRLNIVQINLDGQPGDNYSICISKEDNDRTKLQPIPAKRESYFEKNLLEFEKIPYDSKFCMRSKVFNNVVSGYSKSKKKNIFLCYFPGDGPDGKSGILFYGNEIGGNGRTFERCGEVPADININQLIENYDDLPNVFLLTPELIAYIAKIPFHTEGSVRVYYKEGEPLRISHTFGAFGNTNSFIGKIKSTKSSLAQ